MIGNLVQNILALASILFIVNIGMGCSTESASSDGKGRSVQTGGPSKGSTSALSTDAKTTQNDVNEDSGSDFPQSVAGAFLCNTIDPSKAQTKSSDSNSELVGCAVVDNSQKIDLSQFKIELIFKKASDGSTVGKIEKAPDTAKWHLWGFVNRADLKDLIAHLTVTRIGGSASQKFQFPLKNLVAWTQAQGDQYGEGT